LKKGMSGVATPSAQQLAKKWNLTLATIAKKIVAGTKVEKEHTTSSKQAAEIARDHINERPDYYEKIKKMEKSPIVKEAKHPLQANFDKYRKGKLNELGEYDNKGGTVDAEGLTDASPLAQKRRSVKEQGYGIRSYTEKPLVEKKPTPDAMPTGADRGIYQEAYKSKDEKYGFNHPETGKNIGRIMPSYGEFITRRVKAGKTQSVRMRHKTREDAEKHLIQHADTTKQTNEGWASVGHPFTRDGRVNPNAQFYGGKPKQTTTKNDEKDNTYKNSKQGGTNVNKVKPVKEDAVTVAATQHMDTAQSGYQQSAKPSRSRVNLRGTTAHVKGAEYRSGTGSARASLGAGGQMKPTSTNVPTRFIRSVKNAPSTQGAGGQLKPSSTSGSSSFTPNSQSRSMNVGKGMAASKQTSPVVKGMSAAGQEASKKIVPKAASVMATVGKAARAMSGPEGAAVTAAAEPLAKKMASSYKAGHQSFASHGSEGEKTSTVFARMKQPSQGRSVSQYEKDVLTPKASEAPKAPENPKVDAPTPPSRPDYFSRGQAFSAARKEAGGGEGKFSYQGGSDSTPKSYQTNVTSEPYKPSSQLKQTSVKEETKMDNKERINEALDCILENNLSEMKDNLLVALQEKAMEKLEERKKEIAANYFAE